MANNNSNADAATATTTANTNAHTTTANTNAQSVLSQVNHFLQGRGYSEFEAWGIVFNLSMYDEEEKRFKEYVEYVTDLTNGFETPNKVAYEKTTDFEIIHDWIEFVSEYYTDDNKLEELCKFIFSDNSNIINSERIVSEWLEYFAADMRVKIENVTVNYDVKTVYVTGYDY